jgi:dihydrolipoamide dehydrogenase
MAGNDGPVPVRTLAHAARLIREARQLPRYGIAVGEPMLDYRRLLDRVREVTREVRMHSLLRRDLERAGVAIHENAGTVRFVEEHAVESDDGPRLESRRFVVCTGGTSRRLPVAGFELTATHADAWHLQSAPASMLVIGAGATGVQVSSIFNAFGSRVQLVDLAPRILISEDRQVSETVDAALRGSGIEITADIGQIERFERCPAGVRMVHSKLNAERQLEAAVAVVAIGWVANTADLNIARVGVQTDSRGYVSVDAQLRTTAPDIFAAGDVTGRAMVVHEAVREAVVAATNAARGATVTFAEHVSPLGSFTDPEYASVGLNEQDAQENGDPVIATVHFADLPRPIIDGRTTGFCKLIVDRRRHTILGCHIVGERAVELAQLAATAMAGEMTVQQLAVVPFSFPTYAGALGRAAIVAAAELDPTGRWAIDHLVDADSAYPASGSHDMPTVSPTGRLA